MRYIKNYTEFLITENKINDLKWNNFFLSFLSRIDEPEDRKGERKKFNKFIQILAKNIFTETGVLDETDKKIYSNSNTTKRFNLLMDEKYNAPFYLIYNRDLGTIIDYLNDSNTTINDISSITYKELVEKANDYHNNLKATFIETREDETSRTDKFIVYPDGWYWINLNVSTSLDEKENMGHCGQDLGKILFSLRDDKKQSHITVSYSKDEKAIYQIKGKHNSKPKSIYHHNIVDLLLNDKYPINYMKTGGYRPDLDFSLIDLSEAERNDVLDKKPSLEYTDAMFNKYMSTKEYTKMLSMFANGYVNKQYINLLYEMDETEELLLILEKQGYIKKDSQILFNILDATCRFSLCVINKHINIFKIIGINNIKYSTSITTPITVDELKELVAIGLKPDIFLLKHCLHEYEYDLCRYITSITQFDIHDDDDDKEVLALVINDKLDDILSSFIISFKLTMFYCLREIEESAYEFLKHPKIKLNTEPKSIIGSFASNMHTDDKKIEMFKIFNRNNEIDISKLLSAAYELDVENRTIGYLAHTQTPVELFSVFVKNFKPVHFYSVLIKEYSKLDIDFSDALNNMFEFCDDMKYCFELLDEYNVREYINISNTKKKELKEYLEWKKIPLDDNRYKLL